MLRRIKLSTEERSSVRNHLAEYMRSNPLSRAGMIPGVSTWSAHEQSFISLLTKPFIIVTTLALLFIVGGGAYAAEQSLPGSPLYPIKIHIIEEVRTALAVTPKAKARVETKLAERRLEELEQLTVQNAITTEIQQQLETQFETHAQTASTISKRLENEGDPSTALEIQSSIESSLNAHAEIITRINDRLEQIDERLNDNTERAEELAKKAEKRRKEIESEIRSKTNASFQAAAEGKRKAARQALDQTKLFIEQQTATETELRIESTKKLADAENVYAEGEVKFAAKAYTESVSTFQESIRKAQEARLFITKLNKLQSKFEFRIENDKRHDKEDKKEDEATSTIEINTNGDRKTFNGLTNLNLNIPVPGGNVMFKYEQQDDEDDEHNGTKSSTSSSGINFNSGTTISTSGGSISSESRTSITSNSTVHIDSDETWINGVKVDDDE